MSTGNKWGNLLCGIGGVMLPFWLGLTNYDHTVGAQAGIIAYFLVFVLKGKDVPQGDSASAGN